MAPSNQKTKEEGSAYFNQRVKQFAADLDLSSDDETVPFTFVHRNRFAQLATGSAAQGERRLSPSSNNAVHTPSDRDIQDLKNKLKSMREEDLIKTPSEASCQSPEFWSHPECKNFGVLAIRRTVDDIDHTEKVFISKVITSRKPTGGEKTTRSIVKICVDELNGFINDTLIPLHIKVSKSAPCHIWGLEPIHDIKSDHFWKSQSVVKSPLGTIHVRPFLYNQNSRVNYRLWQPVTPITVNNFENIPVVWHGPQMSLSDSHYLGLIKLLMEENSEIRASLAVERRATI